jgi:2-polyprenyl-3-methyl-5-hydroxy-6-metoxy-1,4-benzoquinol methylase
LASSFRERGTEKIGMDLKEVAILGDDQDRHWYYATKARALRHCLDDRRPARILDVGAGSGFFSKMLLRETDAQSAVCVDPGYANEWSETTAGKPIAFRRSGLVGDADLVLLMDVIEHVDDDVELLRRYAGSAQPGTRFVVSVPAFSWLWGPHDDFLEHRRRYTLEGAVRTLTGAGLTPVRGFYFFAALFPVVAARRVWRRLSPRGGVAKSELQRHHPFMNTVLTGIFLAEAAVARYNRAFGLTAFAIAEKT